MMAGELSSCHDFDPLYLDAPSLRGKAVLLPHGRLEDSLSAALPSITHPARAMAETFALPLCPEMSFAWQEKRFSVFLRKSPYEKSVGLRDVTRSPCKKMVPKMRVGAITWRMTANALI